jgi:hypothetical protein
MQPDWENFAKAVLTDWPTGDLDGSVLFDLSLKYGMIQEVPGGYNSDHHIDADCICPEEGDPWYEYTFRGEAGPGLYSISNMTKRIQELHDENARLRDAVYIDDLTVTLQGKDRAVAIAGMERALDLINADLTQEAKVALRTTLAELKGEKDE